MGVCVLQEDATLHAFSSLAGYVVLCAFPFRSY